MNITRLLSCHSLILCWFVLTAQTSRAATVTFDTSVLPNGTYYVSFQLLDGNTASNNITLNNFRLGAGAPGSASTVILEGGAMGSLQSGLVMLSDSNFLNSFLQQFTAGSTLGFDYTPTRNVNTGGFEAADEFSFAILSTNFNEVATTDPSGGNSLLRVIIDLQNPTVLQYQLQPAAVPEPATLLLLSTGLVGIVARTRCRKRNVS